jgi:DNA-binding LacI/PurR family transcriptional regulator
MKRPTIADVARAAGVSKGAASYALNGQPGVSDSTRRKVLAIAESLGFRANSAARVLAGAPSQIVGMTLNREAKLLGVEPFFMELISGLEAELANHSYGLLVRMASDEAAEADIYRGWWTEGRADGVLVCDVRLADKRIPELEELGMPAVVIGPPSACGSLISVWSDDDVSTVESVRYLAALGHRRIARVAGFAELAHTRIRTDAFVRHCGELRLTDAITVTADYTKEGGARATRELLMSPTRPTAVIYDNDIMAVAGLAVAAEMGISVPADLSIIAWDDSQICQLVHPPLTALSRDICAYGTQAARLLLAAINGEAVENQHVAPAHLNPRGTTAPPRQPTV